MQFSSGDTDREISFRKPVARIVDADAVCLTRSRWNMQQIAGGNRLHMHAERGGEKEGGGPLGCRIRCRLLSSSLATMDASTRYTYI